MSFLAWIILGALAGWIGSMIVNRAGEGLFLDIVLGIVGGLVGGWLFSAMGSTGVTGFNIWSLFVAVIGSVIVLMLYHAIARPHGPSHA
ncbi:MAG TPA: GlsB/YeaQ/YmgE family stress response membrane protein [Vicinamibacterales bacterium]|nr:GlsB/YeaQ/YmgE family stress response membrane protein [Vicinamibacterales bacterium]